MAFQVPNFWNPETLITPTKKYEHPLPKSSRPMNYIRSEGFIYEADAVRESLLKGMKPIPFLGPYWKQLSAVFVFFQMWNYTRFPNEEWI